MKVIILGALAGLSALALAGPGAAMTPAPGTALAVPQLAEKAACMERRVRTVRPDGSVVVRRIRRCGGGEMGYHRGWREDCRVSRQRIVRADGRVVHRTVRSCG